MRYLSLSLLLCGCAHLGAAAEVGAESAKEAAAVTACEVQLVELGMAKTYEEAHEPCLKAYLATLEE